MSVIQLKSKTVGKWRINSYLIHSGKEAWLIDPGDDFDILCDEFDVNNYSIKGILCTHGHFDHIGATASFQRKYQLPLYIHSYDKKLISRSNLYRKLAGGNVVSTPQIDFYLDDISFLKLNDQVITVLHTPGHTPGSVVFIFDQRIISGDILFSDKVARTDLPGGNEQQLAQTISFLKGNFSGYTMYPGHGNCFVI